MKIDELLKHIKEGCVDAMSSLGDCYYYGKGVDQNLEKAMYWYKKAGDAGSDEALFKVAYYYDHMKDYPAEALHRYKRAANEGSYEAMVEIGDFYYDRFVCDEDAEDSLKEAIFWYKKAAGAVYYPKAQLMLGKIYYYGRGVEQNLEEAIAWYESAANQGNPEAMDRLGDCYYYGKGVEQNREKAMYWYNRAR